MVAEATTAASGVITSSWIVVLLPVISALLTLYTGWDYFRAGVRHLIEE